MRYPTRQSLIVGLLAAAIVAPTVLAWATGRAPASYRMFTRPERLALVVVAITPRGALHVPLARLAPHLTADARRVLAARGADGTMGGEVSAEALAHALPGLAELVCMAVPSASSARVVLERRPHRAPPVVLSVGASCAR